MGQKVHPYGMRVGYTKPWKSRWYSEKDYAKYLLEDDKIRKYLEKALLGSGVSKIDIERSAKKVRIIIYTARPGIVIGRRGAEIDKHRAKIEKMTDGEVFIDIKEVKRPQVDAQLVAQAVAVQLEKRVSFRRAMKRAISLAMQNGAEGIKIQCKGRLGGAEIARAEWYKEGRIPLSTFRVDIDYGYARANTTYGVIGVKVWISKGDVMLKKIIAETEEAKKEKEVVKN